ncbi:MAG: DNA primase [Methylotenera sp.]|nr:DNA primase [Methylotenera sp.]MDO9233878.1 DNA primase [Methylotenera sp.]MDO9389817.1 DNA primase [Methylotenera sp.]MDP2102990.1 DNA primase [Methylotenera sp.]MDP2282241.1 DNA primase [Methylotenera sp.]
MIPESFIQELLNRVDIVDVVDKSVPLKKAGANYSACCPFHNEKSPSFTVSPTKQFYHCFGCGAHGTAVGFLMEYQGLSFVESINELARMVGMSVPQEARDPDKPAPKVVVGLQDALQQAAQYYKAELKKSDRAIEYLKSRGLSGQVAAKFQVGYAPAGWQNLQSVFPNYDNEVLNIAGLVVENEQGKRYDRFRDRIMFPIHDQKGQVIGFGGRVINADDTPKYYNSPETPLFQKGHELYGLFLARRAIREAGRALVVEGYMDVVALAQYGIEYAVAALGTATTPFHITKLMRQTDEVVFCFDGDSAGLTAAWRAAMNALPALTDGLKLSFLFLPKAHDPDSYVREFGREKFEAEIKAAMPLSQYILQHLSENNTLQSQEDRVRFLNEAEPIMQQINAPRSAMYLRKKVAELAQLSTDEMQSLLKLPNLNKVPAKARPKLTRTAVSLQKRFCLMLLMHPALANQEDLLWIDDHAEEGVLLRQAIEICLQHPHSKLVVLLRELESRVQATVLRELERELSALDETLDLTQELMGARQQLQDAYSHRQQALLLARISEKPLNSLTAEEISLLRSVGSKPSQNRA